MVSPSNEPEVRGRVLVTGAAGFTGRYLVRELTEAGYTVIGTAHHNGSATVGLIPCNLCDRPVVSQVVEQHNLTTLYTSPPFHL